MSGGGARVSIPAGVRRMIQNIKEIAENHSDEEIYAMLKECSMDPNETTQKLLLQDTFHEVKRKRDKRKESVRETADPRWRPGMQGRGGRGGRGNYSRSVSNDAAAGRNVTLGKENGIIQGTDKANASSSAIIPDAENKPAISITSSGVANGLSNKDNAILSQGSHVSGVSGVAPQEESSDAVTTKTGTSRLAPVDAKGGSASGQSVQDLDLCASSKTILASSLATHGPSVLGTIKQVKPQGSGTDELSEKSQVVTSSFPGATGGRSSTNYNNRFQHPSGLQKAPLPNKEWKPKSVHTNPSQASEGNDASNVPLVVEAVTQPLPSSGPASEGAVTKLEKKLEELRLADRQHVIIPNHLQVPESERHGLSFGSFDANFELNMVTANGPAGDKIGRPLSETSEEIDETTEKPSLSILATSPAAKEAGSPERPQSPEQVLENYPMKEASVSTSISAAVEYDESKQEAGTAPEGSQNFVVQSAPSYPPVGLVPQLGSQFGPFESSEPQARDASRLPSFLVQQPYDASTSYYTPLYRPTPDADGRISPFLASGASTRYNGNIAVLPAQAGQASQENTNSSVLSTVGSTPTQAASLMQGSVAVPQQTVPVFRQPAGLHISHYPPNYIPYSQYFPPFYVPPPALHHFLSGAAFPQQPPTGSMYPTPGATNPASAVKFSLPQYKPGANSGNSTIVGLPTVYGTYNSTPAGYTPASAPSTGNSTANEDLGPSQFKENNVYMSGQQQSEGSAVWIPAPGRDISSLQASSFYSIPPQGQHMTFAPTQAGHGAFSGIYPPTPTVAGSVHPLLQQSQTVAGAVEMLGPPAGVYQQPQRAQINWSNNY